MGNELKCLPFFAFCGDMDYQKQCSGHFLGALTGAEKTGNSLHKALETTALEMHSIYYDVYSDPDDKLNASMFVSLFQGTKRVLYKIWGPKVTLVERMDCMGSGAYLARALTGTYWEFGNDMIRTALAATYILSEAKKHVDGCSGDTQVVCLSHDSAWSVFGQNTLPRIDPMLMLENRYQVWKQRFGALLMDFQDLRMSHLDFEDRLSRLSEHLLESRKERTDYYDEVELQEIQAMTEAMREADKAEES